MLEVPRDPFLRFVTGEAERVEISKSAAIQEQRLSAAEADLLATYRRLHSKYQRRLREQAQEFETLARADARSSRG